MLPFGGGGDRTAVLALDRPPLTYGELNPFLGRISRQLRRAGVTSDDRVAMLVPNGPEAMTAFLAISRVCACAPLNPAYSQHELTPYLQRLRPKLLIHQSEEPPAAAIDLGIPTERLVVDTSSPAGVFSLPSLASANGFGNGVLPATALVLLTSGTTSLPKMVPLSWANLDSTAAAIASTLQLTREDRALNVMPLFHIHGLSASVLATLRTGGSVVCTPGFLGASFFDWLTTFEPTWYTAVPTVHQAIVALAPRHADDVRRSRLRLIRSASAPLSVSVCRDLALIFRAPVVQTYGMTESAGQLATTQLPPAVHKPGSVGQAAGSDIAIVDREGKPAGVGVSGEIWVRGPNLMSGYVEDPDANRDSFRDGWFRTGDLGRFDSDGHLFITGRAKDIINRGGEKISPQEIDDVVMTHPAVHQCVAFSLPDAQLGEEVGIAVVQRSGATIDAAALQHFTAARLAQFKVPRRVIFVDSIPLGPNGKLQRTGLIERLKIDTQSWKSTDDTRPPSDAAITNAVALIMASVLGIPDINQDVKFFDAGGDSLSAAHLLTRLERELGKTLTIVDLFHASSARAIAAKLDTVSVPAMAPTVATAVETAPVLSSGQLRLWLHDQFEDSLALHTLRVLELHGVDEAQVRQVLVNIVERHEPLRTIIRNDDGVPRPQLRAVEPFAWVSHDWTDVPLERREATAHEVCLREASRPFHLDSDLMLRASFHRLDKNRVWLLVVMHHVATDGWSWEIFRRELQTGLRGEPWPVLTATYSEFVRWQEAEWASRREALHAYWAAQLEGLPPLLELPIEFPRPMRQTYRGHVVSTVLPASLAAAATDLGRGCGATLFMTLLTAWTALLSRYAGSADIAVGTATGTRGRVEFEQLIGIFTNTLVLRTRLDGDPTFSEALDRVRTTCLGAWDHNLPFEQLLKTVPPARDGSHAPYFQVFFQLRNFPRLEPRAPMLGDVEVAVDAVLTDLEMTITQTAAGLHCRLGYNRALFTERFARAMLRHFETLLRGALARPDTRISRLPLLQTDERARLMARGTGPRQPWPDQTVVESFERQAAVRGDDIAILFGDSSMTYGELNRRANQLARTLIAAGVGPDQTVALCMERSAGWIVAMLAVAKAGGAYLPIDPRYPPPLIHDVLRRGRAIAVLAADHCRDALQGVAAPVIWTADWARLLAGIDDANVPLVASPDNLAHVFFTSGSTGRPKGVATEHRNLAAYLNGYHWMQCSPADTSLQFSSITFDPSAAEVWGALCQGGRCAVYADGLDDVRHLAGWIRSSRVTIAYLSSSVFNTLVDEAPEVLRPLRRILIGGEALSVAHVRKALDLLPRTELINGYGPTETTIYFTGYRVPRPFDPGLTSVPIGKPMDNGCVYIVDRAGELVPDGLPGELWLGGDTVARGYLGESQLTADAFPDAAFMGGQVARVYRTGDRARWLPSGELEFLGRLDHQIKVRGVRIELGGIDAVLREYAGVRHAVTVATPHSRAGYILTSYVQLQEGAQASSVELRDFLAARLPIQMMPTRVEVHRTLPLTASGKIDRQKLQEWSAQKPEVDAAGPAMSTTALTSVEEQLAEIWKDVLGITSISRDHDFFDLGGDSLLAVRLAFQVERQFGVHLTLASLVESATLSGMATLIRSGSQEPVLAAPEMRGAAAVPMLCIGAGPLFRPLAEALAPHCQFRSVPTPAPQSEGISSMEQLAAQMIPDIQRSYPHGPLVVAGWSLAGVVAIELASQLERAGREVHHVVLFDSMSPVRLRQWFGSWPLLRQWHLNLLKVRYHLEETFRSQRRDPLGYLIRTARDARSRRHYDRLLRQSATGRSAKFDIPLDFRHSYGVHAARYSPAPLRAPVLVVRPERRKQGRLFAGDLGWAELGYQVELLTVPGDHERMFRPPNASVLAERVLERLGH